LIALLPVALCILFYVISSKSMNKPMAHHLVRDETYTRATLACDSDEECPDAMSCIASRVSVQGKRGRCEIVCFLDEPRCPQGFGCMRPNDPSDVDDNLGLCEAVRAEGPGHL
jgi:hypothetical protein